VTSPRRALVLLCAIFAAHGCSANTPPAPTRQSVTPVTAQLPAWLPGVWTREWIERAGTRTSSFDVHYLQTPNVFADVRIPRNRAVHSHATSFADLSDGELRMLARQRGFAGLTTMTGDLATWHHEIDFQPPDSSADVGRLERIDDSHMLEHALDSSYVEAWRSLDNGAGRFLALRDERAGRLERVLLIAGDHFLYVRSRAHDLPPAESLDSLIAQSNASRARIIEYVDCEFSVGRVRGGSVPWEIQQSTLPWREGRHLDLADSIAIRNGSVRPSSRGMPVSSWTVRVNTFPDEQLGAIFAH